MGWLLAALVALLVSEVLSASASAWKELVTGVAKGSASFGCPGMLVQPSSFVAGGVA